jgi:two-component system, LytTR family, response regulator
MTRALIIDDEAHNRDTLGKLLQRYCPEVTVVGKASGVKSGVTAIGEFHPDLVFLDMNMADGTGFDLLHSLMPLDFRVIFVSAMDKNLVHAFRLSGMEYLLKPVDPNALCDAVRRVMDMKPAHFSVQLMALEQDLRE